VMAAHQLPCEEIDRSEGTLTANRDAFKQASAVRLRT
jgi:hypothetical protein